MTSMYISLMLSIALTFDTSQSRVKIKDNIQLLTMEALDMM